MYNIVVLFYEKQNILCYFVKREVRTMENKTEEIVNERIATDLKTSDFYYELPQELIAQSPSEVRDMCRLMVIDRDSDEFSHKIFHDIIDYLNPEDMLVVNSSKVIPARLIGRTKKTEQEKKLWSNLGKGITYG